MLTQRAWGAILKNLYFTKMKYKKNKITEAKPKGPCITGGKNLLTLKSIDYIIN